MDSRLDNGRLEGVFGLRLPDWREALSLCLEEDAGV
jgi:dTDP-4-dehydrorhamnose reductase